MRFSELLPPTCACVLVTSSSLAATFEDEVTAFLEQYPRRQAYDYAVRCTGGDPGKLNTWLIPGRPKLIKAGTDVVPRTNNDTYYQLAVVWLEDEPVVLNSRASSMGRFSSFQLQDDTNTNYRNVVHPGGAYTLYYGARPNTIQGEAIEVPSRLSFVFVRVEVRNENAPEDVADAENVLAGMAISGSKPLEFPQLDPPRRYSADVVAEAHRRMDEAFATLAFARTVVGPGQKRGKDVPYLYHAAGTKGGFGGPAPAHSAYEAVLFDEDGNEMAGRRGTYAVTTTEPPVDAFWSVTVYDTDRGGFLHPNARERHHINDTAAIRNADGTVTFTFKEKCAPEDSNCLEVPAGRFDVVARYYLPREEIVNGSWTLPNIALVH